ncbi:MAG: Cyclopropane-fatty-acyl-phospholipid synthase [Nocardia sp.]|nr:Cyclopropane-fatty-acyl-phospholipid synthase [Nocardia sp.]
MEIGHASGPFADPDRISALLTVAGFTDIGIRHIEADGIWGRDIADTAEFVMGWGPVRSHRMLADFANDGQVRSAIAGALEPFATPGGVRLRGTAWLVTATTPLP